MRSPYLGSVRIIIGTIAGGMLGFYIMHKAELKHKEMWEQRLEKYEQERKAQEPTSSNEFQESL